MEDDKRCQDVTHLTLSYTFFPVEDDEEDTRSEAEKDAAMQGVRLHGTGQIPGYPPFSNGHTGATTTQMAQVNTPK
jgi:hypothetical protein